MTNSIKKGKAAEREVVQMLNETFQTEEFKRVPQSGAFGTIHKGNLTEAEKKVFVGDIITPDWFTHNIEVKNVKDINLWKIFDTSKTPFDEQVEDESKQSGKPMLLVFRTLKREWLCIDYDLVALPEPYPRVELADKRIIMHFKDWLELQKRGI